MKQTNKQGRCRFEKFASSACKATDSTPAFIGAFSIVIIWAITGALFDYSETY